MKGAETSRPWPHGDSQSGGGTHGPFLFLPGKGHIWALKGHGSAPSEKSSLRLFMPSLPRSVVSEGRKDTKNKYMLQLFLLSSWSLPTTKVMDLFNLSRSTFNKPRRGGRLVYSERSGFGVRPRGLELLLCHLLSG